MRVLSYEIGDAEDGMSVNAYARNILGMSMHFLRSVKFKEDGIAVNGQRVTTRYVLHRGDILVFTMEDEENEHVIPTEGPVTILWENEDLVLVNKEAGQVVHPCHGHYTDTLVNHLAWHYRSLGQQVLLRPIGRLDKDTSGLILIAKNKYAARYMDNERYAGGIRRYYLALCDGWVSDHVQVEPYVRDMFPEEMPSGLTEILYFEEMPSDQTEILFPDADHYHEMTGLIDAPIEKVPEVFNRYRVGEHGRPCRTYYQVLYQGEYQDRKYSLIRLKLATGRTHQIRVHMAYIGHPLLGDPIYGQEGSCGFTRAALHSYRIETTIPAEKATEIIQSRDQNKQTRVFRSELPEDFQKFLRKLSMNSHVDSCS